VATSNEDFLDALVRRQIGLVRLGKGVSRETFEILDATETDIRRAINEQLSRGAGTGSPRAIKRLRSLLGEVQEVRSQAWKDVAALLRRRTRDTAVSEVKFMDGATKTVVPTQINTLPVDLNLVRKRALQEPFLGNTLAQWTRLTRDRDRQRIAAAITDGLTRNQTPKEIARRVVGSSALRGRNGVTQLTRNQLETLALTANMSASSKGREEFMAANLEFFDDELFIATLDSRTTPICRSLDGKRFKHDDPDKPVLPLHFRERSLLMPILDDEAIGDRPSKPFTEGQLVREYSKANDISPPVSKRRHLPHGHKGKFDAFSRRRSRELTGQVPAKTTYDEFLKRQSAANQDDILGRAKGKLYRDGNLSLDKFVDEDGTERTLDDLARNEPKAFKSAGLDPEDFFR
jgi:SPP1 gp7 family putative phage head morphogenesis protein